MLTLELIEEFLNLQIESFKLNSFFNTSNCTILDASIYYRIYCRNRDVTHIKEFVFEYMKKPNPFIVFLNEDERKKWVMNNIEEPEIQLLIKDGNSEAKNIFGVDRKSNKKSNSKLLPTSKLSEQAHAFLLEMEEFGITTMEDIEEEIKTSSDISSTVRLELYSLFNGVTYAQS